MNSAGNDEPFVRNWFEHNGECKPGEPRTEFDDVIHALTDLFILRGPPAFVRSDNGPEFLAQAVRDWITAAGANTADLSSRWTKCRPRTNTHRRPLRWG
jgi:hypothetical protein